MSEERDEAKLAAAARRVFDAMPDPPQAIVVPFDHEAACGLVLKWAAKGVGFGEITFAIDKRTGEVRADTECTSPDTCGRLFMALGDYATGRQRGAEHAYGTDASAPTLREMLVGDLGPARRHLERIAIGVLQPSPAVLAEIASSIERCVERIERGVA